MLFVTPRPSYSFSKIVLPPRSGLSNTYPIPYSTIWTHMAQYIEHATCRKVSNIIEK